MHPWPPPERASFESDPRIAQVEKHFSGIDRVLPGFQAMHPMGARLPQECVALTAHDFASLIFHTSYRVPSYQAWLERADLRPVYASHRRWLQYLQWRCPAERWVLKSPGHLWALDALLAIYPDARIVQTHRDPLEVVASLVSLITKLRGLGSDAVDPLEIGADWASRLAAGLRLASDARERASGGAGTLRRCALPGSRGPRARAGASHLRALRHAARARGRGAHAALPRARTRATSTARTATRSSFAGLEAESLRPAFADYQRRFDVASEPTDRREDSP